MWVVNKQNCSILVMLALGPVLGGCDARFTAELATEAPADPDIVSVQANVRGLEFQRADAATKTLEFRAGELVDLRELEADANLLRLFTDEHLPVGTYTGVRLLFDKDEAANAVATSAAEFPLRLAEGSFAAVDFKVEGEKRSKESITLVLDLRQSLSFDEAKDEYTLTPRLRAVKTDEAARIEGSVTTSCPTGATLATGGAIYLYSGKNVVPDDLDGSNAEPFSTSRVLDSGTGAFKYALRFLPAGNYTLAPTCRGDQDTSGVSDELDFGNADTIALDAQEQQLHDVD